MAVSTVDVSRIADDLVTRFDRALVEGSESMARMLSEDAAELEATATHFRVTGRLDRLALLRLRESVCHSDVGEPATAFQRVHDAWVLVAGRAPRPVQALVLTQLATAYEGMGQARAALRAIRRAEALLAGVFEEGAPQMLAVRAQLVRLLQLAGQDTTAACRRRDRSLEAARGLDETRLEEHRARLRAAFVDCDTSPSWALSYLRRWRNVHGR